MKLLEDLRIQFDQPLWAKFPELAVYDTILEKRIDIIKLFEQDVLEGMKNNNFGRKDTPSVEQIVRAVVYKESRGITYEELELQQFDSEICKRFLKLGKKAYSDSMYQAYTAKIKPENIKAMMYEINKIAIEMGYEDVEDVRTDSTVVQTNIHHPTNNSLVHDCIKTSTSLLMKMTEKHSSDYNKLVDRYKEAKSIYYNLNNIKIDEKDKEEKKKKRAELMKSLFEENLNFLKKISDEIKQAISTDISGLQDNDQQKIKNLDKQIGIIYKNAWRFQIEGKKAENKDKIFSIYEQHTDIIVKGLRECIFGHKVNISSGKSNLILDCDVEIGNPSDVNLFLKPLENIQGTYQKQIRSIAHDGGYASLDNQKEAQKLEIRNIVFTKVVGSLQNIVESPVKEKFLHNFRAGAEAIISNLKRGFDLVRVDWKGFEMFKAKVFWGVVGYNIRVLTAHILGALFPKPLKG
jgi:IS5 family transposase